MRNMLYRDKLECNKGRGQRKNRKRESLRKGLTSNRKFKALEPTGFHP